MTSVLERKIDLPVNSMRFVDGEDHFQGGAAVVHAAFGLAVVFDGVHEVLGDPDVALAEAAVFEGFGFADAGAGDGLPFAAAACEPGGVGEELRVGEAAGGHLNDAAAAVDGQMEAVAFARAAGGALAGEIAGDAAVEAVHGADVIAEDGAHA